jgi:hypothetical protein
MPLHKKFHHVCKIKEIVLSGSNFTTQIVTGRPKTAICCVSKKIQAAYVDGYTARPGFFHILTSHHFRTTCKF